MNWTDYRNANLRAGAAVWYPSGNRIKADERVPAARTGQGADRPTVSAIVAPRAPSGLSRPSVLSTVVWCSISEFSSAPQSTIIADIHIQVIRPIAAPREP